jgi:hypothetical protein
MEDWKDGRLEGWKIGRMEDWKIGRLEDRGGWKKSAVGVYRRMHRIALARPSTQPSNLPFFQPSILPAPPRSFPFEFWWAFFLKAFETLTGIGGRCAKSPGQRFEHQRIVGVSVY